MNDTLVATVRRALSELPEGTRYGTTPALHEIYLPRSHLKALHPDNALVTGMRGAGKTFWWSALQDPYARGLVGEQAGRLPSRDTTVLNENTVVRAGFGERPALDRYPNKDVLVRMMKAGVDPRAIWRSVQAWQLLEYCEEDHPLRQCSSWEERAHYVADNPEATERFFQDRDDELEWKGICFF